MLNPKLSESQGLSCKKALLLCFPTISHLKGCNPIYNPVHVQLRKSKHVILGCDIVVTFIPKDMHLALVLVGWLLITMKIHTTWLKPPKRSVLLTHLHYFPLTYCTMILGRRFKLKKTYVWSASSSFSAIDFNFHGHFSSWESPIHSKIVCESIN